MTTRIMPLRPDYQGEGVHNLPAPPSVAEEYREPKPAVLKLLDLDKELKAAAAQGNTGLVRRLRAEKRRLEDSEARKTERYLALARSREIPGPTSKAEEAELASRAKQLTEVIRQAKIQREQLVVKLTKRPESDSVADQIDRLAQEIEDDESELRSIREREAELEQWSAQRERDEGKAAELREWQAALPTNQKRLKAAVRRAITSWQTLAAALSELDDLRESLRGPVAASDPLMKTYDRLRQETGGGVTFDGQEWHLELIHGARR